MFEGKSCLVTGGTGMIGRKVVDLLCSNGAVVTSASLDDVSLDKVNCIKVDLREFSVCQQLTKGIDYVFHLAGVKGNPKMTEGKPASFLVPIVMMNTNILEACRLNHVEGVVYTSSKAVLSDSLPGYAKMMGEKQIESYRKQYGLDNFQIVRLYNVFGEGDNFDSTSGMVIPSLMGKIMRGDNPVEVWGNGSDVRAFSYSGDVAKTILERLGSDDYSIEGVEFSIGMLVRHLRGIIHFNYVFTEPEKYDIEPLNQDFLDKLTTTWDWFVSHQIERKQNYFNE